jgi:hypothetical protein
MPFVSGTGPADDGGTGTSTTGRGLVGESTSQAGVVGVSQSAIGVWGESTGGEGVHAISHSVFAGVTGVNDNGQGGPGTWGESQNGEGVHGISHSVFAGVTGVNDNAQGGPGTWGESQNGEGVHGISHSNGAGVAGYNDGTGPAIYGSSASGAAGYFDGNVTVSGYLSFGGADCAEQFDVAGGLTAEPGTVMVLDGDGALAECTMPYDTRVAGVVSGAGAYHPGIMLDAHHSDPGRAPIALMGKACCKVDAGNGPIVAGDLLTTSPTPGCAMAVSDAARASGAVIGKALAPCAEDRGLIPILVTLH